MTNDPSNAPPVYLPQGWASTYPGPAGTTSADDLRAAHHAVLVKIAALVRCGHTPLAKMEALNAYLRELGV